MPSTVLMAQANLLSCDALLDIKGFLLGRYTVRESDLEFEREKLRVSLYDSQRAARSFFSLSFAIKVSLILKSK